MRQEKVNCFICGENVFGQGFTLKYVDKKLELFHSTCEEKERENAKEKICKS